MTAPQSIARQLAMMAKAALLFWFVPSNRGHASINPG